MTSKNAIKKNYKWIKKEHKTKVFAITSGKGGVGKTNIVANIGYALSKMGKRVMILDADLGLGNIDVLIGIAPKYNLAHVISGEKKLNQIIVNGPGEVKILPASSGIQEMAQLKQSIKDKITDDLIHISKDLDILLIDTAAGISSNVIHFNLSAEEILVVATPDPTSITDAYALMKVLSVKYGKNQFKLIVNMVKNDKEAENVFQKINGVCKRFLKINVQYFGYILEDRNVKNSVREQKITSEIYPYSDAAFCYKKIAADIYRTKSTGNANFKISDLWEELTDQ